MDNLSFNDYEDFARDIADNYELIRDKECNDVAVVAKYEEARQIIKELLCTGYNLHSIEMHDDGWDGYDSEYIVSLWDNEIWCEPMLRNNGYLTDDSPIIYILDNCSSKVIPYCKGKVVYEVSIGETDECIDCKATNNSESTYVTRLSDGTPEGFSKSWCTTNNGVTCYSSYSHYSNDIDSLKEIAKRFGVEL